MLPQCFILIGRSGSGKGTQAKLLIEDLKKKDSSRGTLYIQTGQELREFIKGSTYTEKKTKETYDRGELTPEFLALYAWIRLLVTTYDGTQNLIFDGTPRKVHEAGVINSLFEFYAFDKPWVINIDIDVEEAVKRLMARKRQDDNEETIRKRLHWYETDVAPTIEYFRNNPRYNFLNIPGERSIEEIHADIAQKLGLQ
jgi:adenylate kinase